MGLIHAPRLLFLDEPSTGLDPQNRANLQEHIRALRTRHGTTVVLTTHYLDEADSLAERVIVIDGGRVIADDTPTRLKTAFASEEITLTLADDETARQAAKRATDISADITHTDNHVTVRVPDAPAHLPALLHALATDGTSVIRADVSRPTLDDVFLNLTGRSLREGHAEPTRIEVVA
jgi:ABC-2 type transport system ATP-binding protein